MPSAPLVITAAKELLRHIRQVPAPRTHLRQQRLRLTAGDELRLYTPAQNADSAKHAVVANKRRRHPPSAPIIAADCKISAKRDRYTFRLSFAKRMCEEKINVLFRIYLVVVAEVELAVLVRL
jgi:hypothetical protein